MSFFRATWPLSLTWLVQRRQEELEREGQFTALPGSIEPPFVNICPPSPQNNKDPKTGSFNV